MMYSQGRTPFSDSPNLYTPRLSLELMFARLARPGVELKHAKCPFLVVVAADDDLLPSNIARDLVAKSEGSTCLTFLFLATWA